jgi:hypothetical protein
MSLFGTFAKWPRHRRRPIIGADRKCSARSQNDEIDPLRNYARTGYVVFQPMRD